MLDLDGPYAVDVDNSLNEPLDFSSTQLPRAGQLNLLHEEAHKSGPNLALYRRIVHRSSDKTLNEPYGARGSPLQSLILYCTQYLVRSPDFMTACDMALILLERADADGGGVDLRIPFSLPNDFATRKAMLPFAWARDKALAAQVAFRAALPESLDAALLAPARAARDAASNDAECRGLPVRHLMPLIISYILRPTAA
jgi:hypothetical protein